MRTSDGTNPGSAEHSAGKTFDARHVSEILVQVTQSQAEFLDLIRSHGYNELIGSLKKVHDLALYFTSLSFGDTEKTALYDLKVLWEGLERLETE
ncbi:hypothetical protein [Dyadobacter luticola]|uniref:Uncharacterized protein n=1 Tax=Dyadobacter luticola TaxID=1979387 RepID=A0A5R9L2X9_9BACT|nr:hypothetical protein [Dyadobacter luticola]TLV02709.1 hypothetical protein FEN17_03565 [Dyadobacter luticola]